LHSPQGLSPTLLGVVPYAGIKFFTYQSLKALWQGPLRSIGADSAPVKPPLYWSLLCGGAAGLVGQTATYPLDIVRRRMQVEGGEAAQIGAARTSVIEHLCSLSRSGLRGMFKGLTVNYLRIVPQTAIGFTTYDAAKTALGLKNHL